MTITTNLNEKQVSSDEEIKKILEENQKLVKEIHGMTKKIKSYLFWSQVFGIMKILLILIPIAIGFIYLPPLLDSLIQQYQGILESANNPVNMFDVNKISPEILKMLQK